MRTLFKGFLAFARTAAKIAETVRAASSARKKCLERKEVV